VGVFQLTTSHDLLSHIFRLRDETRSFRPEARQHAKFPLPVENCNFSEGNPQFPLAAENRDFPDQNPNSPLEAENAGIRPQQETAPIFIAKNVTEFWLRPLSANSGQERLQYYLWTYSAQIGAQIWMPKGTETNLGVRPPDTALAIFAMDAEIVPFAPFPQSATIAALSRVQLHYRSVPIVLLQAKQQSYLPIILLHQISNDRVEWAHAILGQFRESGRLLAIMEFLLHHSMDTEAASLDQTLCLPSPTGLVLAFLRHYPYYLQCVVRCARKTDFSHWGRLFPLAGTPLALFEECLKCSALSTASHYLLVLQRTEGSLVAHQNAVRLLDALLHESPLLRRSHVKIAIQLMRFLHMSKERNTSNYDRGVELQRRISDASSALRGPLPERRPSSTDQHGLPPAQRQSWAGTIVDWFTL